MRNVHFWGKDDLRKSPPIHVQTPGLLGSPDTGALTSWGSGGEGHQTLKAGSGTRTQGWANTQGQAERWLGQAIPLLGSSHHAGVGDKAAGSRGLLWPPTVAPFTLDLGPHSLQAVGVCREQETGRLGSAPASQPISQGLGFLICKTNLGCFSFRF